MTKIRVTQSILIDGQHASANETVTVSDQMARMLIGIGRAVLVADQPAIEPQAVDLPGVEMAVEVNEPEKAVQKRKRKKVIDEPASGDTTD